MAANRSAAKSAAAFRTISEVSDELQVPQHVLRFWETKFTQVRPMKRGGGRRYYRPEDIELLRQIRDLLYGDGYTIKGVQKLLREGQVKPPPADEAIAQKEREGAPPPPEGSRLEREQPAEPGGAEAESESASGSTPTGSAASTPEASMPEAATEPDATAAAAQPPTPPRLSDAQRRELEGLRDELQAARDALRKALGDA